MDKQDRKIDDCKTFEKWLKEAERNLKNNEIEGDKRLSLELKMEILAAKMELERCIKKKK